MVSSCIGTRPGSVRSIRRCKAATRFGKGCVFTTVGSSNCTSISIDSNVLRAPFPLSIFRRVKKSSRNSNADDALMLDISGFVAETNATNVFIVRKGDLATSKVVACPEGITRATVIEIAAAEKIRCVEADLSLVDVYSADEMFCTGTM